MFTTALYKQSPLWLQEGLISVRARARMLMREGSRFQRVLAEISESQWYNPLQLQQLQQQKLREILCHAVRHVPFYRRRFAELGLDERALSTIEDLSAIPWLDKATVVREGKELLAKNTLFPGIKINTSGSTGSPLCLLQNPGAVIRENAFVWRQLLWAGFRVGDRRAWIRGDMVVPFKQSEGPFWRENAAENMLMMSSYHLRESTALSYIAALEQFDPVLIQAYPSSIAYLARFLQATGRSYGGRRLRAVVTSSENLTEADRTLIEQCLRCRVYDHYGNGERVALIQTCEVGNYHLASDYAWTELVPTENGRYELVGTGFNNLLMPLIRYRTRDTVEVELEASACACGRRLPRIKRVLGRADDYLKTADGRAIGRIDHIFKGIQGIVEAQLVQSSLGEVTVKVVPLNKMPVAEQNKLITNAKARLGESMRINIEMVDAIPRGANGKFRAVICTV
ncbi:MAG: phenylacetate--CoA ligase family protein [Gammaproteobacteria bacterium]|nr:phenylacetate--CoA ligase family protein [Gammaproteobacteria bacterium]